MHLPDLILFIFLFSFIFHLKLNEKKNIFMLIWFDFFTIVFLSFFHILFASSSHHSSQIDNHHHPFTQSRNKKIKKMKNRVMIKLGCATSNLSQNMFFTGTIPLTDVMHQNHQSVAMTQNRTPPTLFQYPSKYSWCFYYYSTRCLLYFRAYAFC